MSVPRVGRGRFGRAAVAALPAALALSFFAGCGGCASKPEYPPNLTFPARTDPVVLKLPEQAPTEVNNPLKRNEEIAGLDALGGRTANPANVPAEGKAKLEQFLKEQFGTPAAPTIAAGGSAVETLKLSNAHLAEGSKLFRAKCQQCHNLIGDGRGAAGTTLPFARDYRQGQFKFVTADAGGKPRRDDLLRTLQHGLKGTPMPSFGLMQPGEWDLLAGYVTYLAVRGQVEFEWLKALAEGGPYDPDARLKAILAEWEKAETAPPLPEEPKDEEPGSPKHQDAVRRGYELFTAKAENSCISCHGAFGKEPKLRYEVWGTVAKPANLTTVVNDSGQLLKGGTNPQDVYARIRFGIPPVGMPAHPQYSDRQVWDLVRFVRALPYPVQLPAELRDAVYPK